MSLKAVYVDIQQATGYSGLWLDDFSVTLLLLRHFEAVTDRN